MQYLMSGIPHPPTGGFGMNSFHFVFWKQWRFEKRFVEIAVFCSNRPCFSLPPCSALSSRAQRGICHDWHCQPFHNGFPVRSCNYQKQRGICHDLHCK